MNTRTIGFFGGALAIAVLSLSISVEGYSQTPEAKKHVTDPPMTPEIAKGPVAAPQRKLIPVPKTPIYTPATDEKYYYTTYRRPNDDTFQNGGDETKAGVPFQVGWMHCGVIAKEKDGKLDSLKFRWDYEDLTGRHAHAPKFFLMREAANSTVPAEQKLFGLKAKDADEKKTIAYGEQVHTAIGARTVPENTYEAKLTYPTLEEVNARQKKLDPKAPLIKELPKDQTTWPDSYLVGTKASAEINVLKTPPTLKDGEYSGYVELRTNPKFKDAERPGLEQTAGGSNAPKNGVYKRIRWRIVVKDGRLSQVKEAECERFNPNQPLQAVKTNMPGKSLPKYPQEYTEEGPEAECQKGTEIVADGNDAQEAPSRSAELTEKIGKALMAGKHKDAKGKDVPRSNNCTSCHRENGRAVYNICQNGLPRRAPVQAGYFYSWLLDGLPGRTPPYPPEMKSGVQVMRNKLIEDAQLRADFREWVTTFGLSVRGEKDGKSGPARELEALIQQRDLYNNVLEKTKTK